MEKRKKKKERDPQDKEKEKREKRNSGVKKLRKNGLFVKSGEVRRALMARKSMYILYNKEIAALDSDIELPSRDKSILQEFQDVFPKEIPQGLPPLRGIEHQIDLVLGAVLPNRPTCRSNPQET